jgi:hypothetical protein
MAAVKESIVNLGYCKSCTYLFICMPYETGLLAYYDLYLTHSALGGKEARLAAYKALLDAKSDGLIRSVGVSN